MLCRPPGAAPRPRGRPRLPFDVLKPRAKRARRALDANASTALVVVETPATPVKVPKKRGPHLMPYAELTKEGRRKRDYRARVEEERSRKCILPLLDVAAAAQIAEAQEQAAAAEAAAEQPGMTRWERELAALESRGCDGRISHLSTHRLSTRHPSGCLEGPCCVCYDDANTFAPCCAAWLCAGCVRQQKLVYARSPSEKGAPRDGGPVPVVDCRSIGARCPACRADDMFSAGARGLLTVVPTVR